MILIDKLAPPSPPPSTQAVDLVALVGAQEIPAALFGARYTLSPAPGDEHTYAALRETLQRTHRIGIVFVVLQAKPQLAALLPRGDGLVLNTLRCGTDAGISLKESAREVTGLSSSWGIESQRGLQYDTIGYGDREDDVGYDDSGSDGWHSWIGQTASEEAMEDALLDELLYSSRKHPRVVSASRTIRTTVTPGSIGVRKPSKKPHWRRG